METARPAPIQIRSRIEPTLNESGLLSSESVLDILKLIWAGSPLSEVLTIIAQLVESQREDMLCTIWLPDEDGSRLQCAAAPSLPGFRQEVGPMLVGPNGASSGTAVYRREPVYVTDILSEPIWDDCAATTTSVTDAWRHGHASTELLTDAAAKTFPIVG